MEDFSQKKVNGEFINVSKNEYILLRGGFIQRLDLRNGKEFSAFTATELLEMLPESIDDKYLLEIGKENGEYIVYYVDRVSDITDYCFNKGQYDIDIDDKNLCNALAKMLCYLKENNLIKN